MSQDNTQGARSGSFGSAANLMIEALEKASSELEKTVSQCLAQLSSFADGIDESLTLQLDKVVQQSTHMVDSHGNVLEAKRDETIDAMSSLESREMEKLLSSSIYMRRKLDERVKEAIETLKQIKDAQLKDLNEFVESPSSELYEKSSQKALAIEHMGQESITAIDTQSQRFEAAMSDKAKGIDDSAQDVIEEAKEEVENHLSRYSSQFDEKIELVQKELSDIVEQTVLDIRKQADRGVSSIDESRETNRQVMSEYVDHWQEQLLAMKDRFQHSSQEQQTELLDNYHREITAKLSGSQDDINRIASSARRRMSTNQKLFLNTLRRAERQLSDDLDRLFTKFEAAIAQESKINLMVSGGKVSAGPEVLEKLHNRLKTHGAEIIKTFKQQVEQTEQDFARSSQGSNERIESIRQSSVEALEKQVRIMRTDLERITRNFHTELSDLNLKLPMIEESGRAAALAVMTYKSAMLSLEND